VIGLSSRPLERYWTFPFITPRERPVIQQRKWREKGKKKPKKRRRGVPELDVPLLLPAGPGGL
jgi:hypothetical protein